MSPKIVDKEQRKRDIAHVALELFGQKGFEATSISDIARVAGIGKGTVYEYFDSKEALIVEAFKVFVEDISVLVEEQLGPIEDPIERLRAYASGAMEAFVFDQSIVRLTIALMQLFLSDKKQLFAERNFSQELMERPRRMVIDTLLEGVSRGVFRPEVAQDAEKIAVNLLACLDGIGYHYWLSESYFDLGEQMDYYMDQLIDSLRSTGSGERKGETTGA